MKLFSLNTENEKIKLNILGIKISFKKIVIPNPFILNPFKKPIFRNDDVSIDTNLAHFKEFCEVFHKFGFTQLHAINLWGYTNCNYLTGNLPTPYEGCKNLGAMENSEIIKHSKGKFIGDNKELTDYINSIPDEIALHGLYHTDYSKMSYEEQYNDIKEGIRLLKELFPNKKVKVFVAPFNRTNKDTYRVCRKFNLKVSAKEGKHLEEMIQINDTRIQRGMLYRYHHHRFYPESKFSCYDLSIKKLIGFFRQSVGRKRSVDVEMIKKKVEKYNLQKWYIYAFENFKNRKHQYICYKWILKNIKKDKTILESGCGIGGTVLRLNSDGYKNLSGYDYDDDDIKAAQEINDEIESNIEFFTSDGKNPQLNRKYDVIIGINWIYHVAGYSLDEFIKQHVKYLNTKGCLIFDVIDKSYNKVKNNEYSTQDWNKPINERRPSEYLERCSYEDVEALAKKYNLKIVYNKYIESEIPHAVYVLKKRNPKRICLLCDVPNWAHDHSAQEIVKQLSDEFYFDIKYVIKKPKLKPKDYDLIQVFFWGEEYYKKFKWPKNKIIKQVSSHRWQDNPQYGPLTPDEFYKKYLSDANTIVCPSKILYDLLKENCKNLYLCPKGFSPLKFFYSKERQGDFSICWAGNIKDSVKGVEDIIIPATKGRFKTDFASDLKHEELCEFYNNHDVYVVASKNEADPLPLIESMACGCFPVANYVGIAPEIIKHKVNGYLVKERTVEAYSEAFEWCQNNIESVRKAGRENAKLMFDTRRWEITAEKFRNMYKDCLKGE